MYVRLVKKIRKVGCLRISDSWKSSFAAFLSCSWNHFPVYLLSENYRKSWICIGLTRYNSGFNEKEILESVAFAFRLFECRAFQHSYLAPKTYFQFIFISEKHLYRRIYFGLTRNYSIIFDNEPFRTQAKIKFFLQKTW